jgi:hypothetical protein
MSSLLNLSELVGFFSYSRRDDEHSEGALSRLRARIYAELRLQLGREFRLWQDTAAIPDGALWEDEIKRAIDESAFFIPIVTPSAVASGHCRVEFESFLKREAALGRRNLIFPILYVRVPELEQAAQWRADPLLSIIGTRQYIDWHRFRHRSLAEPEIAERIERYCGQIVEALRQPWTSPQENASAPRAASLVEDPVPATEARPQIVTPAAKDEARRDAPAAARPAESEPATEPPRLDVAREVNRDDAHEPQVGRGAKPDERPQAPKAGSWLASRLSILSDGRGRFATGTFMLMNAAFWFVATFLLGAPSVLILLIPALAGLSLMTMRGWPRLKWPVIVTLAVAAAGQLSIVVAAFGGVVACLVGLYVCWAGWTPLRRPLNAPLTRWDVVVLFLLLVSPYWTASAVYALSRGVGALVLFALVYALCVAVALVCARLWQPRAPEGEGQSIVRS